MTPSVMWFRRDLRLRDHPALDAAAKAGPVCALFVLDDVLLKVDNGPRTAYLYRSLRSLDADLRSHGGRLTVKRGRPENVVPRVAKEIGAGSVHVSEDFAPYGKARDARVEKALGDVPLVRTGSPYAVSPGHVLKQDGEPFKVFTPFYRAWSERGWHSPSTSDPGRVEWHPVDGIDIPRDPTIAAELFEAGEAAAHQAWRDFQDGDLARYNEGRNRPDLDSTSHMSVHLKFGEIHPRTMLTDLGRSGPAYRRQLCWRDFYAQVLHFWPQSAHGYFQPSMAQMRYDTGKQADERFEAWRAGQTGFPIVDAGMRQLLATGLDAQPAPHDRRLVPRQGPPPGVDARRHSTSWTPSSTATWPTTSTAGSGPRGPAPTRLPTSASSTRSCRRRSSTPTAPTCGGGCPS